MLNETIHYDTHEPRNQELIRQTQAQLLAKIASAGSVSYIELVSLPLENEHVPYDVIDTALVDLVNNGLVVKTYEPTREGNALVCFEPTARPTTI